MTRGTMLALLFVSLVCGAVAHRVALELWAPRACWPVAQDGRWWAQP